MQAFKTLKPQGTFRRCRTQRQYVVFSGLEGLRPGRTLRIGGDPRLSSLESLGMGSAASSVCGFLACDHTSQADRSLFG